jgi:hypothetical protein
MRVLVDYIHEELYDSLLRLFEDRLGWEAYRPTGPEWFDSGLWRLNLHPAVRRRCLEPPGQVAARDHYEAPGPGGRVHRLVTVEQCRSRGWDFLVASAPEHERPWQRLAASVGARVIRYVGNTRERVDWTLPQLVLAAARLELEGPGVVYHPEFSLTDFRYEPPEAPHRITSLLNHLHHPEFRPAHEDWLSLQRTLPEAEFREHGNTGRDGNLSPGAAVAAAMRGAGWGFHAKPLGDGYGFIVHQWAAAGRPLIGRARYYAGLLAEPFWQDGVTAVDLASPDAPARIRAIASDPARHRRMCEAIAARFRSLVDFDAEAAAVRALLA